jgi:hypothetical protein
VSSKLGRAGVFLLVLGQLAVLPLLRLEWVRTGPALAVVLIVGAYLALRAGNRSSRPERIRLVTYLGASAAIVLALTGPSLYGMSRGIVALLAGWSVPLALLDWGGGADVRAPSPRRRTELLAVAFAAAAGLWIAVRPPGPHPLGLDESLYLLQSQYMRHAPFMWPLDQAVAPFFLIRQTYSAGGYINGQYPPGWPLVLSLASSLRSSWVLLFGTYAAILGATFAFGRAVAGPRTGILAAALLAVNGFFLNISTQFLPHVFGASLALAAGTCMVVTIHAPAARRTAGWAAAGLLMGFAVAVRPLTGVTLAASLWLWVLLRQRPSFRSAALATGAACAGGLIPAALLMYYNLETTGALGRFGYDLAEHGLHAFGFGIRGFVEYTNAGVPTERAVPFGLVDALKNVRENLYAGLLDAWPAMLVFPIAFLAARAGVTWRRLPLAAFAILPVAHFFYFYHFDADRFYFELLPFAMVATAFLIDGLARRRPALGVAITALLVATMLVDTGVVISERRDYYKRWTESSAIVERLRAQHPKLLVFVHSDLPQPAADPDGAPVRWWGEPGMQPLYWYNVYGFPSDVIVARDLGPRDSVLSRLFPGRYEVELSVRPAPPGGVPWVFAARPKGS